MYSCKVSKKRVNGTEDEDSDGAGNKEQPPKKRRHIVSRVGYISSIILLILCI